MESKSYQTWNDYQAEHPELAEIPSASKLQHYEEQLVQFVVMLFR